MADYKYAYNGPAEGTARAVLRDAPISTKVAIEIASFLRGKNTEKAKDILERVLKKEQAIPYKRFTNGVGHRKGRLGAGRYPQKASQAFLDLIRQAEANASHAGLSTELIIKHLAAHKASTPWHYGRQRRRKMKRTHVEIVVAEDEKAVKKKATTKKKQEEQQKEAKEQPKKQESTTSQEKQPVTPKKKTTTKKTPSSPKKDSSQPDTKNTPTTNTPEEKTK